MRRVPKISELTYRCKVCDWLCTKKHVPELARVKTKTGNYGSNATPTPTAWYDEQYSSTTILFVAEGEHIINGDMELDSNWSNVNTPPVNERSNTQKHGGAYSRRFTSDSQYDGIAGDTFLTITRETYNVELWVYQACINGAGDFTIGIVQGDGSGWAYGPSLPSLTKDTWVKVEFSYTESSGGNQAAIKFYDDLSALQDGDWYVDDVSTWNLSFDVAAVEDAPAKIYDSANRFADKHFRSEQPIKIVTTSGTNDGTYTIAAGGVSRGTLTLDDDDSLTTENAATAGEVTISDVTYEPNVTTGCPHCGSLDSV